MLTDEEISKQINKELDKVEKVWKKVGPVMLTERHFNFIGESAVPSNIPGYPFLVDGNPQVQDFIALVLDIRNSTSHLLQAISEKTARASQLERVLYETTAINTAGILIVEDNRGKITEFLGDGFLALLKIDDKDPDVIYSAYDAANRCLSVTLQIINRILYSRYGLPPLIIGIGMAFSKAIVTLVGTEGNYHAKALGECIYRASKLSKGNNEIYIDERLKLIWPSEEGGILNFTSLARFTQFKAYKLNKTT